MFHYLLPTYFFVYLFSAVPDAARGTAPFDVLKDLYHKTGTALEVKVEK